MNESRIRGSIHTAERRTEAASDAESNCAVIYNFAHFTLPCSIGSSMRAFPKAFVGSLAGFWFAFAATAAVPEPEGAKHGMVVSAHRLASQAGVEVLKQGGNAVDAAVATAYALAVTFPEAGNLGGGGFMLIRMADGRESFIDFRETAPAAATRTMYLDASDKPVPLLSTRGYLSVAVPGTVAGLELARERFGTRPRTELVSPAIALAEQGFVLDQGDAEFLAQGAADF